LNHVGLWVDDLDACFKILSEKGIKFAGGIRKGASGHNVTFIHPKSAEGVLVELVQAPSSMLQK
jgi:lactoylglutathione lyase